MSDDFIDTNNPEINVEKIMEKIREEVASRRQQTTTELLSQNKSVLRRSTDWNPSVINTSEIRSFISSAETYADAGAEVTPMLKFQGLRRRAALFVGKIVIYLASFITDKQRNFNGSVINALRATTDSLERLSGEISTRVRNETDHKISFLKKQVESIGSKHSETRSLIDELGNRHAETRTTLEGAIDDKDAKIRTLEKTVSSLKSSIVTQERRISIFLEEAKKRLPEPFDHEQLQVLANEEKHLLDALYVSFEDQFRGTREDIKERAKVYLPYIKEAKAGIKDSPVLDIGCGRGEWLELLKEEGFQARGVDINRVLVEQCRERGLEVAEGDMITYLRNLPDTHLGAVTGFHIIEHLPLEVLINLLDETVRVLRSGGIAIFETPNPQNVLVGSCNFYLDPTHRNPLPSPMMKFLAEARGLCKVEILNLHPYSEAFRLSGSKIAERFNEYFYGPQDYAVVGVKL